MTRQNRVLPTGEIVALPFRGMLTGNRGILHDAAGRLGTARWRHKNWISCALAFKGRRRVVMSPGTWTELFFADEAVALAAGHRPCAECRRGDFLRYREAWAAATGTRARAPEMDAALHAARLVPGGRVQRRYEAETASLPDGTFVIDGGGRPGLLWAGCFHAWIAGGYERGGAPPLRAIVLTPAPNVAVLAHGYRPVPLPDRVLHSP